MQNVSHFVLFENQLEPQRKSTRNFERIYNGIPRLLVNRDGQWSTKYIEKNKLILQRLIVRSFIRLYLLNNKRM